MTNKLYVCKKHHPDLTVGSTYKELAVNPNVFNAFILNDKNEAIYVPRDEFFRKG